MNADQFDALATLMRMPPESKSREAARLVLVEDYTTGEAAERVGVRPQTVSGALANCRDALNLARIATSQS